MTKDKATADKARAALDSGDSWATVADAFVKDFTKRWRDKTECSDGYTTSDCKNGPKPTPTPTAPATDPTQQVPVQTATPAATEPPR